MEGMIDITRPIWSGLHVWPGSPTVLLERSRSMDRGDDVNVSMLHTDVHAATHIDAPLHFFAGGPATSEIDLQALVGPVLIVACEECDYIDIRDLGSRDLDCDRILFKTRNSYHWRPGAPFDTSFVALSSGAAEYLAGLGLRLVGIDGPSVQRFGDGPEAHLAILGAGTVILEGLDLSEVVPGAYDLICLPLKLVGAEGAPARAVLREIHP